MKRKVLKFRHVRRGRFSPQTLSHLGAPRVNYISPFSVYFRFHQAQHVITSISPSTHTRFLRDARVNVLTVHERTLRKLVELRRHTFSLEAAAGYVRNSRAQRYSKDDRRYHTTSPKSIDRKDHGKKSTKNHNSIRTASSTITMTSTNDTKNYPNRRHT